MKHKNFVGIKRGVYLSNDKDLAGGIIEDTENTNIPSEWLKQIIILSIDARGLDPKKLDRDPQMSYSSEEWDDPNMPVLYIYRGNVSPSLITKIEPGSYEW